ncbi:MAG: hypothetical protein AMXMBFR7_20120 [Planctomycetota bacterium]
MPAGTPGTQPYTQIAEQYAQALRSQANFNADFSPASVAALDALLDMTSGAAPDPRGGDFQPNEQQMGTIWSMGCYVGECFRRLYDGEWREQVNPNSFPYSAGVVVQPNDVTALVFMRLFKRFKYGDEKLWPWFDQMRWMVALHRKAAAAGRIPDVTEGTSGPQPGEPPPGTPDEAQGWNDFAVSLNQSGRAEEAVRFLERAVALRPKYAWAWFNLGCLVADQGQTQRAKQAWQQALACADPQADAQVVVQAKNFLERIAQEGPRLQVSLLEAINLVTESPEGAAKAIPTLDHFLKQKPDQAIWWTLKGQGHLLLDQGDEAQRAFTQALALDPGDASAKVGLSQWHAHQARPAEALALAEEALAIDPKDQTAWAAKARALRASGRAAEALPAAQKAIEVERNYAAGWLEKGFAEAAAGQADQAAADWLEFAKLSQGKQAKAYAEIGAWCGAGASAGNPPKHLLDGTNLPVQKTEIRASADVAALLDAATQLGQQGRHQEALAQLDEALRLAPDHPVAWTNKGNRLGMLGRWQEALTCHETALRHQPSFKLGWSNKAFALVQLKRYEEAVAASDGALKLDPRFTLAYINKSMALLNLQRVPQSLETCEAGLAIEPNSPQLLYNAAVSAETIYKQVKAVEYFKRFLQHAPPGAKTEIAFAQARLKMLQ